jgi:hypothetical protein
VVTVFEAEDHAGGKIRTNSDLIRTTVPVVSACTNLCHVFVAMQVQLSDEISLSDSSETERIYVWPFVLHLSELNTAMFGKLMICVSLLNSGYLQVVVLFLDWSF